MTRALAAITIGLLLAGCGNNFRSSGATPAFETPGPIKRLDFSEKQFSVQSPPPNWRRVEDPRFIQWVNTQTQSRITVDIAPAGVFSAEVSDAALGEIVETAYRIGFREMAKGKGSAAPLERGDVMLGGKKFYRILMRVDGSPVEGVQVTGRALLNVLRTKEFVYQFSLVATLGHYEADRPILDEMLRSVQTAAPLTESPIRQETAVVDVPEWKPGYEWTFRVESPTEKATFVAAVTRREVVKSIEYYVVANRQYESYFRKADLAYYMDTVAGAATQRSTPPDAWFAWPLTPRKTWDQYINIEFPRERATREMTLECRVDGEETITVPAGTFSTLKIACRDRRANVIVREIWYSPKVKYWVRYRRPLRDGVRVDELVDFKID